MVAQSSPPSEGSGTPEVRAHRVGRYVLYGDFAAGGMATVHFGRLLGPVGFSRTVAIKRLHPQFARDKDFVAMFLDEARHAARVQHPNVVQTLDVVQAESELLLVMEYVAGESFHMLLRRALVEGERTPPHIAVGIMQQALFGLHAAHEARSEQGVPLELVHRDMSPHNVLVGVDGIARVLDFGIAKTGSSQVTQDGRIKGKLSYFPPEQLTHEHAIDRRADVYASAATLWEALTGRRMIQGENEFQRMTNICSGQIPLPSQFADVAPALEAVVMTGLARDPEKRYATAWAMAIALEAAITPASPRAIGEWVEAIAGEALRERAAQIGSIERHSTEIAAGTPEDPVMDGPISTVLGTEGGGRVSSLPSYRPGRPSTPPIERWSSPSGVLLVPPGAPEMPEVSGGVPPKRRRAWLALLLLVLLLVGAGLAAATEPGRRLRAAVRAEPFPPPVASGLPLGAAPASSPVGSALVRPDAVQAAPPSLPTPIATPASTTSARGEPLERPQPRVHAHAGPPRTVASPAAEAQSSVPARSAATAEAPPAASADCAVPYTLDSQGIRHPKLECL